MVGTALVDMYAKCGSLEKAREVLEELVFRDAITWNTLITGYIQSGQGIEALNCFKQMQEEGFSPDSVTFGCILRACGSIGAVGTGKSIHKAIVRRGLLRGDIVLGNALVDMYAKCGALKKAQEVLDRLIFRDIISWNSLITGYAQQGQDVEVLNCFKRMQTDQIFPDSTTFLCLLNACCHSGLLDDGEKLFLGVMKRYGALHLDYYTCMVDLFCRAGQFENALVVIKNLPLFDCIHVWNALLSACRSWGNVELGRLAFEQAIQLDDSNLAAYILMINIYVSAGMEEDAKKIEAMREQCCFSSKEGIKRY
jgi:pentatricopeptide repeat protein